MTVIAEIGTAHSGSLDKAFALIDAAADAGADCVKFQWVYADEILHPDTGFVTLPGGAVRLYDRFRSLELDSSFYSACMDYARKKGLLFACSPFGLRSLKELAAIQPDAIKIASPEVNHYPLLEACASYYGKIPIILSSGVSRLGDIENAVDILEGEGRGADYKAESGSNADSCGTDRACQGDLLAAQKAAMPPLTLLHCITSYPAPEEEYNVRCVETLRRVFCLPTGISDHSLDPVLIPVLTTAMGGVMIEKHITLSRKTDGLDDPVALEPEQFAQMVQAVHQARAVIRKCEKDGCPQAAPVEIFRQMAEQYDEDKVSAALGSGEKRLALSERANYGRTNRSLHYMRAMKKGERIGEGDISVLRTEKVLSPGISPEYARLLAGCILTRDVGAGAGVDWEDFLVR